MMKFTSILSSASIISLSLLAACGQTVGTSSTLPQVDTNPIRNGGNSGENPVNIDDPSQNQQLGPILGYGVHAVAVNKMSIVLGEERDGDRYVQLRSMEGPSMGGAYYGVGYGNKGYLGFGEKFNQRRVGEFQNLSFRTWVPSSNPSSTYNVHVNFLVDLNCNPLRPRYVMLTSTNFRAKSVDRWNTYSFNVNDPIFKASDPFAGLPDLTVDTPAKPLANLIAAHPSACFVADDIFNVGMPRNQKLAPFQIVFGGDLYIRKAFVRVDDINLVMASGRFQEGF